jgi:hydroxyacylglutathione hydrolase
VYAAGHLEGSVNVGLNGRFASWVGTVVPRETEIVVVAEPGTQDEAITRLARIGYDRIAGWLRAGPALWASRPELVRRHRRISVDQLAAELAAPDAPTVVDVRAPGEYEDGHLAGALLVPLDRLEAELARIPRDRPFVVQCQGGYRSSIAASLLERHGVEVAGDLIGGYGAWSAAGRPVVH